MSYAGAEGVLERMEEDTLKVGTFFSLFLAKTIAAQFLFRLQIHFHGYYEVLQN